MGSSEAATTAVAPEIRIRPPRRWGELGLRELWTHRELVYFLTKRELQIRYKQSFFGVAWAILQPLVLAFVFALFFGRLAKVPSEGIPFPVFAVVGLVPWLFFAQAVSQSANSLVQDSDLLSKVYFPRLAIPLSRALGLLVDLAISLPVVIVVMAAYNVEFSQDFYWAPAFLLLGVLTAFAVGTLFAAVNVKYRDVTLVVPMVVYVWLFVTPVIYPGSLVTGWWEYLYAANPMVGVLEGFRWALLGTTAPAAGAVAISAGSTLLILLTAIAYFRRTERFFADVV